MCRAERPFSARPCRPTSTSTPPAAASGTCGKCRVQVVAGERRERADAPSSTTRSGPTGSASPVAPRSQGDAEVFIPETSRMGNAAVLERELRPGERKGRLLTPAELESLVSGWTLDPVVKKLCMQLDPALRGREPQRPGPVQEGSARTHFGLTQRLGRLHLDPQHAQRAARAGLGGHGHRGRHLVRLQGHRTRAGVALRRGLLGRAGHRHHDGLGPAARPAPAATTVAQASDYNHQISFGEDVISRIVFSQKKEGRERLQQAIVDTINGIVDELVAKARHRPHQDQPHGRGGQHHHDLPARGHRPQVPAHGARTSRRPTSSRRCARSTWARASTWAATCTCTRSPAWPATWAATSCRASWARASSRPRRSRSTSTSAPTARSWSATGSG